MSQSRGMSLIEAITNVAVGYALAVVTQVLVFPWFGLRTSETWRKLGAGLGFHRGIVDPQLRPAQTAYAARTQIKKDQPKLVQS